jgi:hypothetical protein
VNRQTSAAIVIGVVLVACLLVFAFGTGPGEPVVRWLVTPSITLSPIALYGMGVTATIVERRVRRWRAERNADRS